MYIHFIGSNGASIKRLMQISEYLGHTVSGSDSSLTNGHNAQNVENKDLVVYTAAISSDNCELVNAKKLGIPTLERSEFLGMISQEFSKTIAVAGTHGKTTTSSMLAQIFSNQDACMHVGGDCPQRNGKEFFVTEACEYKRSFLTLNSSLAVILNLELDHTDCYSDLYDYTGAFIEFASKSKSVLVFGDDPALFELAGLKKYLSFGLKDKNDYCAQNVIATKTTTEFDFCFKGDCISKISINMHGDHNVLNALAAAASAHIMGLGALEIAEQLAKYGGVARRFEYLGNVNGASIYSDYAHHPTEITATISSAKKLRFKKLTVIFEPHTYTRTVSLYKEFAKSLSMSDIVSIMPIYAAREQAIEGVDSKLIVDEIKNYMPKVELISSYKELFDKLNSTIKKDELVVFMGAGTIDNHAREYVKENSKTISN